MLLDQLQPRLLVVKLLHISAFLWIQFDLTLDFGLRHECGQLIDIIKRFCVKEVFSKPSVMELEKQLEISNHHQQ